MVMDDLDMDMCYIVIFIFIFINNVLILSEELIIV